MSDNLRDLYKKKGKILSKDIKSSKETTKRKLVENSVLLKEINSNVKTKILQLRHKYKIDSGNNKILLDTDLNNKDQMLFLIMSFGLNLQRVEGKKILDINNFLLTFNTFHNLQLPKEIFEKYLKKLQKSGLIYSYNQNELLFEPLSMSEDINKILRLVDTNGLLEHQTITQNNPDWNEEKITNLVNLLEIEGILIKDIESYWFPQFNK